MFDLKACLIKYKWYLLVVLGLVLSECALLGGIGIWREYFWNAVQQKDLHNFMILIGEFTGIALTACFISGLTTYLISYISLLIRTDLTAIAITSQYHCMEGGEQRVQEDCARYPLLGLQLGIGLIRNLLVLIIFSVIIIYQVGTVYLLVPILYTLLGTFVAGWIAKPLIKLNYVLQVVEAAFRRAVLQKEMVMDAKHYDSVKTTNQDMFVATKKLTYFQSFYNQITVVVPYIILCPVYFLGTMVFGVFMQVSSGMNHIIDSMSYLINSFNDFNNWLSCRKRLKELGVIK